MSMGCLSILSVIFFKDLVLIAEVISLNDYRMPISQKYIDISLGQRKEFGIYINSILVWSHPFFVTFNQINARAQQEFPSVT